MAEYDLDLKAARDLRLKTVKFILDPNLWTTLALPLSLSWTGIPFREDHASRVPNDKVGVYSFIVWPSIANHSVPAYLMYIGQTTDQSFRARYRDYLRDQRTKEGRLWVVWMLDTWPDNLWFYYAIIEDRDRVAEIEDLLKVAYRPPINQDFPAAVRGAMSLWRRM